MAAYTELVEIRSTFEGSIDVSDFSISDVVVDNNDESDCVLQATYTLAEFEKEWIGISNTTNSSISKQGLGIGSTSFSHLVEKSSMDIDSLMNNTIAITEISSSRNDVIEVHKGEELGKLNQSLEDIHVTTILEKYSDQLMEHVSSKLANKIKNDLLK